MRAIGMNTLVSSIGVTESNGRWVVNGDGFQRVVDLYRKVGFSKPIACSFNVGSIYHKYMKAGMGSHLSLLKMPPDEFFTDVTASVQAIVNEAKRRGGRRFCFILLMSLRPIRCPRRYDSHHAGDRVPKAYACDG